MSLMIGSNWDNFMSIICAMNSCGYILWLQTHLWRGIGGELFGENTGATSWVAPV